MKTIGFKSGNKLEITDEEYDELIYQMNTRGSRVINTILSSNKLINMEQIEYIE